MNNEEIKSKLAKLEKKLNNRDKNNNRDKKFNVPMTIITELIAGIFIGCLIGYFVDNFFKTMPIFIVLFCIIGFFASLLNMYKNLYK